MKQGCFNDLRNFSSREWESGWNDDWFCGVRSFRKWFLNGREIRFGEKFSFPLVKKFGYIIIFKERSSAMKYIQHYKHFKYTELDTLNRHYLNIEWFYLNPRHFEKRKASWRSAKPCLRTSHSYTVKSHNTWKKIKETCQKFYQ